MLHSGYQTDCVTATREKNEAFIYVNAFKIGVKYCVTSIGKMLHGSDKLCFVLT